ncbi:TPR repeat-containing protein [Methanobrevibacter ruminantium M1]|uniref:TPR repeat-containing protein n=1 Tax=Methanobrevibacter ruminantium (strain ATCC 35063 / DSM 1093 / JCM 13430 / OCM 146 / M1) TaxID=634498 RepID=D3DZI5_METRM|nr:hypothetical protein [Methanobrevibacter ruminantium]ADC47663.1 TPR repeat-containing protein [Methanobrevibacter ruminantium M1]
MVNKGSNDDFNCNNWELGRIFARKGNFTEADIRFEAELNHSLSPNSLVLDDHGHLLNRMGKYQDAIDKFRNLLNSDENYVSSLFGIGISYIGLNKLGDALKYFEKVNELDEEHADAWYYSAIIYGNPFYPKYDLNVAKIRYKNYQKSKESYINDPKYFSKPFDNLSWEELHDYYKCNSLFRIIEQSLDKGILDEFLNFSNDYKRLYCFDEEGLDKQFDIFRLFENDTPLADKIDKFHEDKNIEDKFESAGFEEDLIEGLSFKLGMMSIDDKKMLNELMDYSKSSQLSFNDINDLIRENVLDEDMSLDDFYENREYIVKNRIKKNNSEYERNVEKRVNTELKNQIAINKRLNDNLIEKDEVIEKLNDNLIEKDEVIEKLNENLNDKEEVNQKIEDKLRNNYELLSDENINQPEHRFDNYDFSTKEIKSSFSGLKESMDSYLEDMESYLNECQDVSSMNILSGINNQCYQDDLEYIKNECGISDVDLKTLKSAFKDFYNGKFGSASYNFSLERLRKTIGKTSELKKYRYFLKLTSKSREKILEEEDFNWLIIKNLKLKDYKNEKEKKINKGKKLKKEKYPIGWFNLGNICFDYANSQSVKTTVKAGNNAMDAYELAYFCYKCAEDSISNQEENSKYEFNFKDTKNEQEFKNNVVRMISNCEIKILQQEIKGELKKLDKLQGKFNW